MSRFSDDIEVLDPAYEGLYDMDETPLDQFLKIACETCEPYCDDIDEDDDIIYYEDDDDEDFDDDDDDDLDEDFEEDEEGCCKENAITDATPQEKRARYFKMIDANPRFDAAKKKLMKENYDKSHPEGLSGTKESAADYAAALRMLDRDDSILEDDVDDAYEASDYPDDYLDEHARYAAGIRTGYVKLVEKNMRKLNMFQGDDEAKFAANLHTSYARESFQDDLELYEMASAAYESAVAELDNAEIVGESSVSDELQNCQTALEGLLADLEDM